MTYTISKPGGNQFNNDLKKSNLYGLVGTTLSCLILFLILWFAVMPAFTIKSTEEEGLVVSFGDSDDGGGLGEMSAGKPDQAPTKPNIKAEQTQQVKQTGTTAKTTNQTFMTQQINSVAIAEQNEKKRLKKEQDELELQQQQINKRVAEKKQREQEAINNANRVNGLFGNHGSGSSSGTGSGKGIGSGSGNGIQGNPAGTGTSGVGFALRLGNRTYSGKPAKPNYPKDVEGKITVTIRVDENGVVTSTSIGSPTTISDSEMRRDAISAANKTRFTKGKGIETGSITYNYKLE